LFAGFYFGERIVCWIVCWILLWRADCLLDCLLDFTLPSGLFAGLFAGFYFGERIFCGLFAGFFTDFLQKSNFHPRVWKYRRRAPDRSYGLVLEAIPQSSKTSGEILRGRMDLGFVLNQSYMSIGLRKNANGGPECDRLVQKRLDIKTLTLSLGIFHPPT